MARKIRLPHEGEEIDRLIRQTKEAVQETRTTVVAGVEVMYSICDPWPLEPLGPDMAIYDHDGNIYLARSYVQANPTRADLGAFHEHTEICHKLAGRDHGYAHHQALLEEFLAAKEVYDEDGLREYIHFRVFEYPDWKIPDKSAIEERLCELLSVDRPLRGKLLEVFREARM